MQVKYIQNKERVQNNIIIKINFYENLYYNIEKILYFI